MDEALGDILSVVSDYDGLVAACVARRHELGLSQMAVDEIAGLTDRYLGKIEIGTKRLGVMSLSALLPALGLELVVRRTVPHHERQRRLPETSCGRSLGKTPIAA